MPEKFFHGDPKSRGYFEGWYFKQQNGRETIAFIPAFHVDRFGAASASIQVVTDHSARCACFPADAFCAEEERLHVRVGESEFTRGGCRLDIESEELTVLGALRFSDHALPGGDMMGPFRHVPRLPCRHSVFSLAHRVEGELLIDGRRIEFQEGAGYIEGDRGVSFPDRYVWTQANWEGNSVMLSVADVPLFGRTIAGIVGFVYCGGSETRIATYHGARAAEISNARVVVRQGDFTLTVEPAQTEHHLLRAPQYGGMTRVIRENVACRVRYIAQKGGTTVFDVSLDQASFEGNWYP